MAKAMQLQDLKQTMSSLDIAQITGKRHSDVLETIRNVLAEAGILAAELSATRLVRGKEEVMYNLPRLETDLVISGYSVPYRLAIIKRWHELEAANNQTLSHDAVRLETKQAYKDMSTALQVTRAEQGKETKSHHYSNESEMLNRIVIGMTSKQFRIEHNLDKSVAIRDHFSFQELVTIESLELANTVMINFEETYEDRKTKLVNLYNRRHQQLLIDEHMRLEA